MLSRLEDRGPVCSYRGVGENNRKARFYRLTALGCQQLKAEASRWLAMVKANGRVIENLTRSAEQE